MSPRRNYRLELEFWGTVWQMPQRQRRGLRRWLRRYRRERTRTFVEVDAGTGGVEAGVRERDDSAESRGLRGYAEIV